VQVIGTLDASGQVANNVPSTESSKTQGGNIAVSGQQIHINDGAKLNASGDAGGGAIVIGDKQTTSQTILHSGSSITAQARNHGKAGTIKVLANMDNGTVKVEGQLNASASKHGDGGFIETSAAHVKVADTAKVSTKSENGSSGTWLIDPIDFTIAAGSGSQTTSSIGANTLSTNLGGGNVEIATSAATAGNGDIFVKGAVTWSANKLTLSAHRNININATLNGSGSAQLALQYGQASAGGGINDNYFINNGAKVFIPSGENFSTQKGSTGAVIPWTIITSLGTEASFTGTDLQGMRGDASKNYALGADINASSTSTWNNGAGFRPVDGGEGDFTGNFEGLGHTITGLTINRPTQFYVGLFGSTDDSTISNVGLVGLSIVGYDSVGGLVGSNYGGTISNSYVTGSVTGTGTGGESTGGLVGDNYGIISNSYATGSVTGINDVGGLVGYNSGTISNSYATGSVTGDDSVGGLVGYNHYNGDGAYGTIINAYATASVSGTGDFVGGLVGYNSGPISDSFWDMQSTGQGPNGVGSGNVLGATGKTSAEMKQLITFSSAGWDISGTGGSAAVWRIYEGDTTPLLRSFLAPLAVTANPDRKDYDGLAYTGGNGVTFTGLVNDGSRSGLLGTLIYSGTSQGAINRGAYIITPTGLYSDQQGYDISLVDAELTIDPATLTATGSQVYNGTVSFLGSNLNINGVNGETFTASGSGTLRSKDVQTNQQLASVSGLTLIPVSGELVSNYQPLSSDNTSVSVTPASLTATGSQVYNGTVSFLGSNLNINGVNGETFTASGSGTLRTKDVQTNQQLASVAGLTLTPVSGALLSNYQPLSTDNTSVSVTQASLLTAIGSQVYNGTLSFLGSNLEVRGVNGEAFTVSGSGTLRTKNVQTNQQLASVSGITLTPVSDDSLSNYEPLSTDNTSVSVTPASLSLNAEPDSRVYDGTTGSSGSVRVDGLFNPDTVSNLSQSFVSKNVLGTNGSTLQVNSGFSVNDDNGGQNYTVTTNTASGTITPASLSLNAVPDSRVYDGTTGSSGSVVISPNLFGSDNVSNLSQSFVSKNVLDTNGSTLQVNSGFSVNDGNDGRNYEVTTYTASGTITPASLSLNAVPDSRVYDGTTDSSGSVRADGLFNPDTVSNLSQSFVSKNVLGTNGSTLLVNSGFIVNDGNDGRNYTVTTNTASGTITPASLSLNAVPDSRVYNGTTGSSGSVGVVGLFNPDTVTRLSQRFASKDVLGTNRSTLQVNNGYSVNDGNGGQNYTVITNTASGTITPATLTIAANDDRKIFDGLAYTGGNGVIYTGLVNNETSSVLAGSLTYGGNSQGAINVGAYDIIPGGLTSGNYAITYINGQLSIVSNPVNDPSLQDNIVPLVTSVTYKQLQPPTAYDPPSISVRPDLSVIDVTEEYVGNTPQYCDDTIPIKQTSAKQKVYCQKREKSENYILPTLKIKNSAGRVKRLQMSANKQFLSLLLEDGSVRIWDFQQGDQHQIETQNKNLALTDISAVDDKGELVSIASKAGIITQDHIIPTLDENLAMNEPDINQFMTSNDGSLLLVSAGTDQLSLWDSKHNKKLWQLPYERGVVNGLALADNKHYGAVLSRQPGSYVLLPNELQLKSLTDAVDIIDLDTGKIIKSLPNVGEQILSLQFKDNDTLQLKLASGELLDWSITTNSPKRVANFAETVTTVDADTKRYAYVLEDGRVRIGDGQGHVLLSIQNKENPFKDALLLEGDKKLLTVMANGELSLWDVASGKKMLRLFSTLQGWTVMDAFGRFDGSEEAMDNFSWSAKEEDIPLDSFSENYYEPGLLSNVMQNQDYLNSNPNMVKSGITLPPKVVLQIAEQQAKGDTLALQLDVYDRGGGIDKIHVYQNGKILSNENIVVAQQSLQENDAEHRVLTLNITPIAGKNTLKVIASNDMGIENSSTELSFDGKTKAYESSLKLLTIGIDQYSDDKLNLDYSVTDADSIGQAIKNTSKVAASINLYNENATKPKILAKLKDLSQGVQQDVLVIFFAGHGLALGKEWYFLPYETKMQPTLEQIAATGISATELSDIFKNSKIQHILLMVDSCYSGAGMDAFSKLENGQRYFTRKLSRSLGITVMTAATKDQKAFELKSLGHGLFTYLVTQELQEKDTNQPVTAHGIAESISQTLPVFSKKMLGSSQEPAVYTKGNDFMLTDVLKEPNKGNASDSNIPVIAPKKLGQ